MYPFFLYCSDELADAVKALLVCLVNNQKSEMSQYDWLMSISLHNLLTKKRFPCTASDTTLTKVMQYWDDSVNPDRLRLVAFKRKVNTRSRNYLTIMHQFHKLCSADFLKTVMEDSRLL